MSDNTSSRSPQSNSFDAKLTAYLAAAGSVGTAFASEAHAVIVANTTEQPFGINEEVNIDFNSDGQVDYQIDHDRVNVPGVGDVDYLQIDKNDVNGASPGEDLLTINAFGAFSNNVGDYNDDDIVNAADYTIWRDNLGEDAANVGAEGLPNDLVAGVIGQDHYDQWAGNLGGIRANDVIQAAYVTNGLPSGIPDENGDLGSYPAALEAGTEIGIFSPRFDFQEGTNVGGTGRTIRANRLIDEDNTQIDQHPSFGNLSAADVQEPFDGPNFVGLNGEVRYLGVKMNLNDAVDEQTTLEIINYGWIGIRIDNEADATGAVVGWAYETEPDVSILAGDTGQPMGTAIPEPGSLLLAMAMGLSVVVALLFGRRR